MTTDLSAKLDLRRKSRRRAQLKRAAIIAAVLALLAGIVWVIWFSPLLHVRSVEVVGNQVTTPEQVIEAAQVPLDTPLASINGAAIRERVLALPPVAAVDLTRNWPNTLVIEVTERQLAYQLADGPSFLWVDADGRIFHTSTARVPGVVAYTSSQEERLLRDVATMVLALPPEIAEQVSHVEASSIDHLVIQLGDRIIIWGNAEKSAEKAALLPTMLAMTGQVIDVSVPSHPAIR